MNVAKLTSWHNPEPMPYRIAILLQVGLNALSAYRHPSTRSVVVKAQFRREAPNGSDKVVMPQQYSRLGIYKAFEQEAPSVLSINLLWRNF